MILDKHKQSTICKYIEYYQVVFIIVNFQIIAYLLRQLLVVKGNNFINVVKRGEFNMMSFVDYLLSKKNKRDFWPLVIRFSYETKLCNLQIMRFYEN